MSKQHRYTVMVPIEIKVDSPKQLRQVIAKIRQEGAFPQCESYGEQCYSYKVRQDLARLKNVVAKP